MRHAFLFALACAALAAADRHVLPRAAGAADGSSWADALGPEAIPDLVGGGLEPGDALRLGSGTYRAAGWSLRLAGTAEAPITIQGEDTGGGLPLIEGSWAKAAPTQGAHGFVLQPGTTWLRIAGLRLHAVQYAVVASDGGLAQVAFEDLEITAVRSGFHLVGSRGGEQRSDGIVIRRCRIVGYTKRGVRLELGNRGVVVEDCIADSGGSDWSVEPFPIGFHVIGDMAESRRAKQPPRPECSEEDIVFRRCTATGNHHPNGDKYWNADGFCAESGTSRIRYIDCLASDNTDGGWDEKSIAPVFVRCRAVGNKRNYRIWSKIAPATLISCTSADAVMPGGSGDALGLWAGGPVILVDCIFSGNPKDVGYHDEAVWLGLENTIIRIPAPVPADPVEDAATE